MLRPGTVPAPAPRGNVLLARLLTVLLCLAGTIVTAEPAVAEDPATIQITGADAASPGTVVVAISTEQTQTWVRLVREDGFPLGPTSVLEGAGAHQLTLDTWGLDPAQTYQVRVSACVDPATETCESATRPFSPTETGTTFTFSEDRVLTGTEEATLTVDGPVGGGRLAVRIAGLPQALTTGTQDLWITDSAEALVTRCSILGCVILSETVSYRVDKGTVVTTVGREPSREVDPDGTDAADAWLDLSVGSGPTSYEGVVVDGYGRPVPGTAVTGAVTAGEDGVARIQLDMDAVPPHTSVRLVVRVLQGTPDGTTSRWARTWLPTVVRQPPAIAGATLNLDTFHPHPDGYRDTLRVRAQVSGAVSTRVEALHLTTGDVMSVPAAEADGGDLRWAWDGTDPTGLRVAAGRYLVRIVATDAWGLTTIHEAGEVRLDWQSLTPVRRAFTVAAADTMHHRVGGRCARVGLGAPGWRDGLSYRVGSCQSAASAVSAHRTRRVPRGWVEGRISLATYSRAASGYSSSEGAMTMLRNRVGLVVQRTGLGRRPGWDESRNFDSGRLLDDRGCLHWAVFAGYDTRHDVRSFRITFDGTALR